MNTYTKPLAIVSSILLSASFAGPAQAAPPKEPTPTTQELLAVGSTSPITAAKTAVLRNEKPVVKAIPAIASPEPVAVEEAPVATQTPAPAVAPVKAAQATPVASAPVAVTPKVAAPTVYASGKGASIAAAAYAQIGVSQDCTALVSNSLAAVGINFHGWPADYLSLGTTTSSPQPGDLIYYQNGGMGLAHIAVYVGNGMAIHGGWNGGTTALFSANVGSGPVYIHVA